MQIYNSLYNIQYVLCTHIVRYVRIFDYKYRRIFTIAVL